MRRSGLFRAGERVGIAVSGGPDSILLLEFMERLARETGLTLAVVHFNHRLRGPESEADEHFVEHCALEAGSDFIRGEADVLHAAHERRRNIEATARELRYRFFFSLVNQGRVHKVATGHTADDQAETVLLRLLRGTGTRGLGGIYPVLEGGVVRPFLGLTREEVRSEVENLGLSYRVDSSNLDTRFARNKVRLELLPWLAKELNPAAVRVLKDLAERAREDESYLEHQARERSRLWRTRSGREERMPGRALADLPPALGRRVLRQMIADIRGNLKGITHTHIEDLTRFTAESQSGRHLVLPDLIARKEFEWVVLAPKETNAKLSDFSYRVQVPGRVSVPELGLTFHLKIVTLVSLEQAYNMARESDPTMPTGLDPLKLSAGLILRSWRPGDRFQPWGSQKPSKLKELLRQRRVAFKERASWPLIESGSEIVWVRGFPPGRSAAAVAGAGAAVTITEEPYRGP